MLVPGAAASGAADPVIDLENASVAHAETMMAAGPPTAVQLVTANLPTPSNTIP